MKNKFFKKALSVFTAMAMMLSLMTGIPFSELGLGITVSAEETTSVFSDAKVLTAVDGALCIDGEALTINTNQYGSTSVIMPEGNYKLESDITTNIHVYTEDIINIDLNGHTWNMSNKNLRIDEGVTLSLYDTSDEGTGKITSSYMQTIYGVGSGTTFNLYSGTVENTSNEVNDRVVCSCYGIINLYGGTIKSNAYAVFYYLHQDITINIDNTSFDCGDGHAQFFASLSSYSEPCAVIDVSEYTGGALTVDARIDKAGKIKIFTGIQSAEDAVNYTVNVSFDANKDFFEEKQEYEVDGGNKYVYVSVPSFTTQPTEENLYTVAFNRPDATLQWCEKTVNSATYSEEDGDHRKSYVVNAGDKLIVSLSECSDDFWVNFDCTCNDEEILYTRLDSSSETASVTFDSEGTVDVYCMTSPFGTGVYKIEHVRWTELEGETGVQLSKTECETTYRCKATLGEREYYSDEVTIEQEHSYTCTATSDNVITKKCDTCGKSGTLTIEAEDGIYDGTTKYGATVIKTGILENVEVTVNYYQGNTLIGTDAPVDAGTYTAKITYEDVTASVTYVISTTPTADMFTYIESAVYDGTEKSANVVVKDGITGIGAITNIKYYQNDTEVTPINAGTYTVKIDVADGDIYDAATDIEVGTFEITKAEATITVGETEYYKTFGDADFTLDIADDNTEANVTYSSNDENVVTVSNGTVTIKGVGSATITVSMGASTNYNAAVDKTVTVNVARAAYSVDTINKSYLYARSNADSINLAELLPEDCGTVNYASVTYNGALTFTSEDTKPKVTNGILAYTLESGAADDTGIIIVDVETQNYIDITITVNVTLIDQITVNVDGEVELNSNILTYGDTLSRLTFKSVDFVDNAGNEVEGTLAWKEPSATPNAGTTSATWVFTPNNAEYASVEGTVAITVNKATPNVTGVPTVADRVYNPYVVLADSDLTGGTVKGVYGNSLAGSWSWQSTNVVPVVNNSGYIAVFTPTDSTNYETVTRTIAVTVEKAAPTITTEPYAAAGLVYDGSAKVLVNEGAVTGGSFVYSLTGNNFTATLPTATEAKEYTVYWRVAGDDNHNNSDTFNFKVTIAKATPPALTNPTATAITYGEKLSASTLSDGWAWVDGTVVPNAAADYDAYIVVDDSNYDYTSVEGYDSANHRVVRDITVIINRATLTITANSYTIKVGDTLPTYAYDVTGLVNGDTLPFNVSLSCSATDSNTVGTYPITISGVASDALASLYTPIYVNGELTITEKDIQEITADDITLTYGETGKKITATTSGDGAISYSTTSDVISVAADGTITALKAGTATVTVKAAETDNYAEATTTISVTVNKKKVTVPTADTTKYTYTGTAQTYGVTSTDDYTVEGGVQTNAGEYPITITLNNENYEWDGTLGTYKFVINKAAVTVTAKSYSIKVGEALPTYAYDVAGLVNGETLPIDVTISCNAADSNTLGTYDIIVSGAAASDNYTFSYVNGTLTVSEKEVVAAPTFTPASGTTFTSSQKVTISCATAGAKIYYTTDGTEPTTASTLYNGAFTITTTTTIKAIAVKDGMTDSSVVTAKYTKNSGGSGGSGGGGGYRPPVVPDDDDDDNDDVVVNDPEDKPDNGNEPKIKGDNGKTGWDAILDELDDADEGDKIVVDMNGETEVPEDVFEQIKGQDIDLVIELDNGFIWTINGKDVTNPADIDLGVNKGSTIPVRVINAVTGECEYITITLAHNGEFGFKAVLTVDMGVKNEGDFANLYWYTDNDTKFICADKIDNKGRANLVFTHASEYVIVIDENDHTPEDDVSAGAGIEEDSSEIPDDFDNDENPYTGVAISFAGIIISAATIMIARKRKKQ